MDFSLHTQNQTASLFFFPLQLSRSRMQIILSRLSKKSEEDEKERVLNVR